MSLSRTYQLNPQTRLRATPPGGAIFFPATVTTVELDHEAFAAVSLLASAQSARSLRTQLLARFPRNFTLAEVDQLLCELARQNFLIETESHTTKHSVRSSVEFPSSSFAPESVHLQLNNVCNLRCPSCYVGLHAEDQGALPLERIHELIDEWVTMGVFQLALGGGEPLMSSKFVPVVRYARERGLVPNATTNGWLISERLLDEVAGSLGELRLSLNDAITVSLETLAEKASLLRARQQRFGFNLIVTQRNLPRLKSLLEWCCQQGAATINLIRPKPAPGNDGWYADNALRASDIARLPALLHELEPLFAQTALAVDCAFSFLFYGQSPRELAARGVAGCAMGERFVTVRWNGDVVPCSHLHGAEFSAGNVMTNSFRELWQHSETLAKVRRELPQVAAPCGGCSHNSFCKGCRAVMQQQTGDWLTTDRDCPSQ